MKRHPEECRKVTTNVGVGGSLRNIYKIDRPNKFHLIASGHGPVNSLAGDCNKQVNSSLKTFNDCDKRDYKVLNRECGNRQHSCAQYLGQAESKSQESLKNVSKNEARSGTANVNICPNQLFTAPDTKHGMSKQGHSSKMYLGNCPENQRRAMEVVNHKRSGDDPNCYYFVNGDLLVKNFEHEFDKTVVYSKQVEPKHLGVSRDEHNRLSLARVCSRSGEPRNFDVIDVPEITISSSTSIDTSENSCMSGLKPLTVTSSQTVSPTSNATCQHGISAANKSINKEEFSDFSVLPDFTTSHLPNKTSYSNLNTPAASSSQFTKIQASTDDRNSDLQAGTMTLAGPCKHSFATSTKSINDDGPSCRICHSVSDLETLVSPCLCTGSMKYVHESCLLNWLKSSVKTNCELCLQEVPVKKLVKPLREWRFLDEKPVALIWLLSFLILLTLNILSVIKDSTRGCSSTTCIAFYVLGCTGAVLGVIFLWFWAKKSAVYFKKLLTLNQIWLLKKRYFNKTEKKARTLAVTCNV